MYSWEIEQFIKDRNYYIGGDDLIAVIDVQKNPQINYVKYNPATSGYYITTSDNYCFQFTAMPINEAINKGLVKTLSKKR